MVQYKQRNNTMKLDTLIFIALILLSIATSAFGGTEERQAREAAETHNAAIEDAEQRMEDAIERARRDYARAAIRTKQAYIRELQAARRTALNNDNAEAAQAIVNEIARVEAQIEELEDIAAGRQPQVEEQEQEEQTILNSNRYIGTWTINWNNGVSRTIRINSDQTFTVVRSSVGGNDVNGTYPASVVDGAIMIRFAGWENRTVFLKIVANGRVAFSYTHRDFENTLTPETAPEQWTQSYTDSFTPAEQPEQQEEEQQEDDQAEDNGNNFFGIPVK